MHIFENILKARSHVAFVIGLTIAATVAVSLETGVATSVRVDGSVIESSSD